MEDFLSHVGDSHFDWDYYLGAIGESEGGFSYWDSCCSPISLQDIGQFLRLGSLSIIQPGFDDLE